MTSSDRFAISLRDEMFLRVRLIKSRQKSIDCWPCLSSSPGSLRSHWKEWITSNARLVFDFCSKSESKADWTLMVCIVSTDVARTNWYSMPRALHLREEVVSPFWNLHTDRRSKVKKNNKMKKKRKGMHTCSMCFSCRRMRDAHLRQPPGASPADGKRSWLTMMKCVSMWHLASSCTNRSVSSNQKNWIQTQTNVVKFYETTKSIRFPDEILVPHLEIVPSLVQWLPTFLLTCSTSVLRSCCPCRTSARSARKWSRWMDRMRMYLCEHWSNLLLQSQKLIETLLGRRRKWQKTKRVTLVGAVSKTTTTLKFMFFANLNDRFALVSIEQIRTIVLHYFGEAHGFVDARKRREHLLEHRTSPRPQFYTSHRWMFLSPTDFFFPLSSFSSVRSLIPTDGSISCKRMASFGIALNLVVQVMAKRLAYPLTFVGFFVNFELNASEMLCPGSLLKINTVSRALERSEAKLQLKRHTLHRWKHP